MGAHAGVWCFDGHSNADDCRAIAEGLRPFASDGTRAYGGGGLTMVMGTFDVWNDEEVQTPPSPGGCLIAWDGRLDNRDDLRRRLGHRRSGAISDAAIALELVEREGPFAFRSLIGEWSVAIWDGQRRRLHLARDYMGVRPLYYTATPSGVCWSTSLAELVTRTGRVDALNDEFAALFMTLRFDSNVTPYVGIQAVPTGTCLSFAPDRTTAQRFWNLEPATIRFQSPADYEERLRELWVEAVGSRLRTRRPVWAELSGGLDSSSVVCMADHLIASGRTTVPELRTISHVTLQTCEGDERRFIAEAERRTGVRSEVVAIEDHMECEDTEWGWVSPYAVHGVGLASLRRIREQGGELVLSGRAGDAVMGAPPDNSAAVFDDWAHGRVWSALTEMRAWSRMCRKPLLEIASRLLATLIRPHSEAVSRERAAAAGARAVLVPRLGDLTIDDDAGLGRLLRRVRPAKREIARLVLGYSRLARFDAPVLPPGVIYAHPYVHRPLVEFMLAIPGKEVCAPGMTRSLMRRAFAPFVPSRILQRQSKGYYPPAAMRAARAALASLPPFDRWEVVQRGWIDPAALEAAVAALRDGASATRIEVSRALQLERWLDIRHRRAPAVIPIRKEVNIHAVLHS